MFNSNEINKKRKEIECFLALNGITELSPLTIGITACSCSGGCQGPPSGCFGAQHRMTEAINSSTAMGFVQA